MSPKGPREEWLTGDAVREVVRKGSAGEHEAVTLHVTGGGRFILQRRGGNPFDDAHTAALVGQTVMVKGFRLGDIFRYTEVLTPPASHT